MERNIAPGRLRRRSRAARIAAGAAGVLGLIAAGPTSGTATASTLPEDPADLEVVKTVDDPTPFVGDTVTFTVTFVNNGPDPAGQTAVTDVLPAGLAFVSATASQGSYSPVSGFWVVGTLANGATATLQIVATVTTSGPITNAATVSGSDTPDPNPANNSSSVTVTPVAPTADLVVTNTVDIPVAFVGATITFTATITNDGPAPAGNIVVDENLSSGLTFLSATPSQGTYSGDDWTVGTLANGSSATLQVAAEVITGGAHVNTAQVTATDTPDPDLSNNIATQVVQTEQSQSADLAVTMTVDNPTPNVGDEVTFTVTVTNHGPQAASSVIVLDELPGGLTLVSASATSGAYPTGSTLANWFFVGLDSGASETLEIVAEVTAPGPHTNTAALTDVVPADPNPANDSASVTVTAAGAATTSTTTGPPSPTSEPPSPTTEPPATSAPTGQVQQAVVTTAPPSSPVAAADEAEAVLPATGSETGWLAGTAGAVVAAGVLMLRGSRRRSEPTE